MSFQVSNQAGINQQGALADGSTPPPKDASRRSDPREQFGIVPHGIVSDPSLKASAIRLLFGLTYWALDKEVTTVSDGRLAKYTRMSVSQVKRVMGQLIEKKYIATRLFVPTKKQPTGREITLLWRVNPSIVPIPMARDFEPEKVYKSISRRLSSDSHPRATMQRTSERPCSAPVSEGVAHPRATMQRTSERPCSALVSDKEDKTNNGEENGDISPLPPEGVGTEEMIPPEVFVSEEEADCDSVIGRNGSEYFEASDESESAHTHQEPKYGKWPILLIDELTASMIVSNITNLSLPFEQRSFDGEDQVNNERGGQSDSNLSDLTDELLINETAEIFSDVLCWEYSLCGRAYRCTSDDTAGFTTVVRKIVERRISPGAIFLAFTNLLGRMQVRLGQPIFDPGKYFLRIIENMEAECDHFHEDEVIANKMSFLSSATLYQRARDIWFADWLLELVTSTSTDSPTRPSPSG